MIKYGGNPSPLTSSGGGNPVPVTFLRTGLAWNDGVEVPANTPRFPSQSGIVGVLVEESGTNILNRFDPTLLTQFAVYSQVTMTTVPGSPFSGWTVYADNAVTRFAHNAPTLAVSTTYTVSAFVLMDDGGAPVLGATNATGDMSFVANNAVVTAGLTVSNLGGGLYRISGQFTTGGAIASNNTGVVKYSTQSARGFKATGFDCKAKAYLTSGIRTTGAPVTMNAETLTVPTAGLLAPSQGSVITRVYVAGDIAKAAPSATHYLFEQKDTSAVSNRMYVRFDTAGTLSAATTDAVPAATIISTPLPLSVGWHTIALRWSASELSLWVDGVKKASAANPKLPAAFRSTWHIASDIAGANQLGQPMAWFATYDKAPSDAVMADAVLTPSSDFTAYINFQGGALGGSTRPSNIAYTVSLFAGANVIDLGYSLR